jgi:pyruvate dehydrogenase E1 component alpha subunit
VFFLKKKSIKYCSFTSKFKYSVKPLLMKKITKQTYIDWYSNMLFWRKFEDKLAAVYIQQKVRGFLHLYNGQEAILAGSLHAMQLGKDRMITAYRNHVQPIGMGVDPKRVMAELYGKSTGTSGGLGGSMHIFSKEFNFHGGHGIVGGQIPLGAGMAFGDKYNNTGAVTLCCMGDGAVRQGSLHETLNLATLWKLPVVFVVENNGYAMGTSVSRTASHEDIWKLGLGYEMPCGPVDGMDPVAVAKAMDEAIKFARDGKGPSFLEMKTYRYRGHSMSDAQQYRTKKEVEEYKKIDPITQIKDIILEKKYASQSDLEAIEKDVKERVFECEKFAEESPYPEKSLMYDAVYEQTDYPFIKHKLS